MSHLRPGKYWATIILTGCFLFVSAGLAYSPETHLHFGHHDKQSHGKTWCTWTCQAGNALQDFSLVLPQPFADLRSIDVAHPPFPDLVLFLHSPSRAPPPVA